MTPINAEELLRELVLPADRLEAIKARLDDPDILFLAQELRIAQRHLRSCRKQVVDTQAAFKRETNRRWQQDRDHLPYEDDDRDR